MLKRTFQARNAARARRRPTLAAAAFVLLAAGLLAFPSLAQDYERLTRNTFADLAAQASPSVVSVEFVKFRPGGAGSAPGEGFYQSHGGSGVIVRPDGVILTSLHIIAGFDPQRDEIRVTLLGGETFKGGQVKLLGEDEFTDLAALKIDAQGLPALPWGDSEAARPGDWAMVIGNPLDFQFSVSQGIISGIHRRVQSDELRIEDLLQTTAVINAGSSGGALVDLDGRLLGIVTAIATAGSSWQGLGFAMPQHVAQPVVESILERGRVRRGYLGVVMEPAKRLGPVASGNAKKGARVADALLGFPAARAGLRPGDLIVAIDGLEVADNDDVFRLVGMKAPGISVKLEAFRGGRRLSFDARLAERPEEPEIRGLLLDASADGSLGLINESALPKPPRPAERAAETNRPDMLAALGLTVVPRMDGSLGLRVMRARPESLSAQAGLLSGDVILEFDGELLRGVTDFRARLLAARGRQGVLLRAEREGQLLSLRLDVPNKTGPASAER